jgi:hypothetical protein
MATYLSLLLASWANGSHRWGYIPPHIKHVSSFPQSLNLSQLLHCCSQLNVTVLSRSRPCYHIPTLPCRTPLRMYLPHTVATLDGREMTHLWPAWRRKSPLNLELMTTMMHTPRGRRCRSSSHSMCREYLCLRRGLV